MKKLFYSEDREVCTYPKGSRFEYVTVWINSQGDIEIEGKGFLGCLYKLKLSQSQGTHVLKLYQQSKELEKDG